MSNLVSKRSQILLIDDDTKYCRLITNYLSGFGYEIHAVHNGVEGMQFAQRGNWGAIILDVMLPSIDGFEILRQLRNEISTPILMLTSLSEEADRIVGLELGADDYLAKTASPRELLARLRAILRRSSGSTQQSHLPQQEIIIGPLCINFGARFAMLDDELLPLTPVEFDLLFVLAQSRGRVKTREDLLNEIRDRNYDVFDRSIDVHISSLRRKMNDDHKQPRFIRTVRSAGYMLTYNEQGKEK